MRSTFKLRVGDVLTGPDFRKAEMVAGKAGAGRIIRWVHIMEVTETEQLLNGNELILSTGVGWHENEQSSVSFLNQLIEKGVSGLCLELGTYIDSIPEEMVEVAERNDFPLIVFQEKVRFIDITQALNGLLMESQYKMMSDLESFSNRLNHLLLSADAFTRILRLLHEYLNAQVIYVPAEGEPSFIPLLNQSDKERCLSHVDSGSPSGPSACQPIQVFGRKFADLVIFSQGGQWTDFDALVLDRAATAIAQEQLRVLYVEEKRKSEENRWVEKWVNGEPDQEEIERHLLALEPSLKMNGCVVCLGRSKEHARQPDFTYYSIVLRSIFEQHGFFSLVSFARDRVIFVLVNQRNPSDWKSRMNQVLEEIQNTDFIKEDVFDFICFGIGKLVSRLELLHESYRMAREVLYVQEKIGRGDIRFYEDLYIFRLISDLNQQNRLRSFVADHLGAVLTFDAEHNSRMLETLKTFLEVNGSKKEAAERLYVVRQTLYHRLDKLKELLGKDFMEPEKRVALEFAIHSLGFVDMGGAR